MKRSTSVAATALLLILTSGCALNDDSAHPIVYKCSPGAALDVVHDEASGTIVHSTSGACVRTHWLVDQDPCAGPVHLPSVAEMKILSKEDQTVYFGFNQASLPPEMIARLDALAVNLKGNSKVLGVRIVGYADRIGNAGYNEKLSKKRAENVRQYLIAKGIVSAKLTKTRWVGSQDSKANCGPKLKRKELIECLKHDRRVEIEVEYAPDIHAAD